jgi:hypothetical protein
LPPLAGSEELTMSNLLRAGAFVLTAAFAVPLVVFTLAQLVEDVGAGWGSVVVTLVLVGVAVLSYLAAVSPSTTARWLGMGVAVLAAYVVAHSLFPGDATRSVVPIAVTVLALPMAVLGLRRSREAGTLLLADGLIPLLGLALVSARNAEPSGADLASSSEYLGIPVFVGGALFLLAWAFRPHHR